MDQISTLVLTPVWRYFVAQEAFLGGGILKTDLQPVCIFRRQLEECFWFSLLGSEQDGEREFVIIHINYWACDMGTYIARVAPLL